MSFWRTFGFHTVSTIDNILDKEAFTLEELLDEEELLQELKSQNKKLIDFLERPETLEQLFKYITDPADEAEDNKYKFKYPFYASEILSSDSWGISDAIYENPDLLNKLYAFLDADPPLNPLLTSYASRVAGMLLQRKVPETVEYLKSKDDTIAKFIKHLGSASVMDLLLKLISCDELAEGCGILTWLCEANLISSLIEKFDPEFDADVHENASQALVDIIAVSTNPQNQEEGMEDDEMRAPPSSILLKRLENEEVADALFVKILADKSKSSILINGLNVVIELCRHNSAKEGDGEELPAVLNIVLKYLQPLLVILAEPHTEESLQTTSGAEFCPFGFARLKVLEFFLSVVCTRHAAVHEALINLDVMSVCFSLFFEYPWNNFLHHIVQQMVSTILTGTDNELLLSMFTKSTLHERIAQCSDDNAKAVDLPKGMRLGYMGFVTALTTQILSVASEVPGLQDVLDSHEGWVNYVNTSYAETKELENVPLGGHKPVAIGDGSSEEDDIDFDDQKGSEMTHAYTQYLAQQGFKDDDFPAEFNDNEEDYDDDGEIIFDNDGRFGFVETEDKDIDNDFDEDDAAMDGSDDESDDGDASPRDDGQTDEGNDDSSAGDEDSNDDDDGEDKEEDDNENTPDESEGEGEGEDSSEAQEEFGETLAANLVVAANVPTVVSTVATTPMVEAF